MIEITIPGYPNKLQIEHVVFDFNGTLAIDGKLIKNVDNKLLELKKYVNTHLVTTDIHSTCLTELNKIIDNIHIIQLSKDITQNQAILKMNYVESLGSNKCACIGNGQNDVFMLQKAALSICILQQEGCSSSALAVSKILCNSIHDAIDMLLIPQRIIATLQI